MLDADNRIYTVVEYEHLGTQRMGLVVGSLTFQGKTFLDIRPLGPDKGYDPKPDLNIPAEGTRTVARHPLGEKGRLLPPEPLGEPIVEDILEHPRGAGERSH